VLLLPLPTHVPSRVINLLSLLPSKKKKKSNREHVQC
jgi:hypothetical protein